MSEAVQSSLGSTGQGRNILLWVLQNLAASIFQFAGSSKLTRASPVVTLFNTLGVGLSFHSVIGAIDVISAILMLLPGVAAFEAALMVCTMIGAVPTHLVVVRSSPAIPQVLLIVCTAIFWGRRE